MASGTAFDYCRVLYQNVQRWQRSVVIFAGAISCRFRCITPLEGAVDARKANGIHVMRLHKGKGRYKYLECCTAGSLSRGFSIVLPFVVKVVCVSFARTRNAVFFCRRPRNTRRFDRTGGNQLSTGRPGAGAFVTRMHVSNMARHDFGRNFRHIPGQN